jgi:hypothetical protein
MLLDERPLSLGRMCRLSPRHRRFSIEGATIILGGSMPFEDTEQANGHRVRLFPTIRIGTPAEAETRATAALLATLRAVCEFRGVIVKLAGGPAGKIECYTEVPFEDNAQTPPTCLRPDGLLIVTRGGKTWRCLVEVKVGSSVIERDQFDKYLQVAKQEEISALITISNEADINGGVPFPGMSKSLLNSVSVIHLSWERLLSEARLLRGQERVDDADQQWILDEWIQYVTDPMSKVINPPSLGPCFTALLTAAKEGNIAGAVPAAKDVCAHWDGFLKKAAGRLRADLGVDVSAGLTNAEKQDNELRLRGLQAIVLNDGRLSGSLKVKNAAADISIDVLLAARAVKFGIEVKAPSDGKQQTRIKWMTKQLGKAPPEALLHVHWDQKRLTSQARVAELITKPLCLTRDTNGELVPSDALPKSFSIEWTRDLQKGKGKGAVLDGIMADLEQFYGLVVEGIVAFVPRAPKMPAALAPEVPPEVQPVVQEIEPPAESGEVLTHATPGLPETTFASQPVSVCPEDPEKAVNG